MKQLSIKVRITLLFTLVMALLVAFVLAFLILMTRYEEQVHSRELLIQTVLDSVKEINWQEEEVKVDEDMDYYKHGVYLGVYNDAGELLYGNPRRMAEFALPLSDRDFRTVRGNSEFW